MDFEEDKEFFVRENINFENCDYGVRAAAKGRAMCATCTLDTFAVIGDRDSQYYGECKRLQNDNKGCAKTVDGKCVWCNFYRGFYMTSPEVCKKWIAVFGVVWVWLLGVLV